MPDLRVPFGISPDGIEAHAETANKGVPYRCPDCGGALILKQGNIRIPHFSHKVDPEVCDFLNETEEHWRAKHAVVSAIRDRLPIKFKRACPECSAYKDFAVPKWIVDATTEHTLITGHRADVALFDEHRVCRAVIEVLVTHHVDVEKSSALQAKGIPWVEIEAGVILESADLSWQLTQDYFKPFTCKNCQAAEIERARRIEEEKSRKVLEEERKRQRNALMEDYTEVRPFVGPKRLAVECPIPGKKDVSPVEECLDCAFWLSASTIGIICFGGDHATSR